MSDWVTNYMKELNSEIKDVQYFRWGIAGHVGVVAIDPDKFRKDKDEDKKGSVAFFDYGCMFTDSFKNPPQIALISENSDVKLNESALSCRINKRIDKLRQKQEKKEQKLKDPKLLSLLRQQELNIKNIFGELATSIKPPYLPQNYLVIYKFRIGQIEGESDCSYNSEIFYSETITNEGLKSFAKFDKFCRNTNKMENIRNLENELKKSAHKATELGLSENPADYFGFVRQQSGLLTTIQNKNLNFFSIVKDEDDQSATITLKTSEKSKKIFKDIELIKITPKKIEDKQTLDLKQIEQNGFTEEILEKNNIAIKRSGVNHFEPMGKFLSKNINRAITGIDNRKQSREI